MTAAGLGSAVLRVVKKPLVCEDMYRGTTSELAGKLVR